MTLQDYQDTMLALIEGRIGAEQAAAALYQTDDEITALRLRDYRQGYLGAQGEGLSIQHPQTCAVVEARQGREGWRRLVAAFLAAHPPRHPHRVVAFAPFPDFVAADPALPAWLGDLARLERAALLVDLAPDTPEAAVDPETRVIAVGWDLLGWSADGAPDLSADPEPRPVQVLTWRDADGTPLQAEVGPLEALALELARGRGPLPPGALETLGASEADLAEARAALEEIGAIRAELG